MFVSGKHWSVIVGQKSSKGFSLLELMVVVTISAILSVIAVPSLSSWIDSSRAKSVRQQLYAITAEARSIALKESQTVTICALGNNQCQSELALPISLFTDNNRNAVLDESEQLIRVLNISLPEKISLSWNRSGYMRFWPSGGTGALTGSLSYCDALNPDNDFRIVVARTGRLRIDASETRCTSVSSAL